MSPVMKVCRATCCGLVRRSVVLKWRTGLVCKLEVGSQSKSGVAWLVFVGKNNGYGGLPDSLENSLHNWTTFADGEREAVKRNGSNALAPDSRVDTFVLWAHWWEADDRTTAFFVLSSIQRIDWQYDHHDKDNVGRLPDDGTDSTWETREVWRSGGQSLDKTCSRATNL